MKTLSIQLSRLWLVPRPGLGARVPEFVALMKPRVMMLAVFTAIVALTRAPHELGRFQVVFTVLAIAGGAGAAGALNMWCDADIDALMARTAMRPIPRGQVSSTEAALFGAVLGVVAVLALGLASNVAAAALLAGAILFYVVVYTAWLKRRTPLNIVIGGAAGALPPVIGWTAATGNVGPEALSLFLIIFFWTPPHFWALALNRAGDYAKAGVPMLPVVAGPAATKRQILFYCGLLVPTSALPCVLGFAGAVYGVTALLCGAVLVVLALQLDGSCRTGAGRRAAHRLFVFSIAYLFSLFAVLLVDHEAYVGSGSSMSRDGDVRAYFDHADLAFDQVQMDRDRNALGTEEI